MEFDYTDHAEENIIERKLIKKVLEDVVKNPDEVLEGKFGRKTAQKTIGNNSWELFMSRVTMFNCHSILYEAWKIWW